MKNKKTKPKTKLNIISDLLGIVIIIFSLYVSRYTILNFINIILPPSPDFAKNLTQEQKLEDFEYLYNLVTQSIPMLDDYEEIYGYNFKDRKEMYKELVINTKDDLEFYAVMESIVYDVPSFHTDLVSFGSIYSPNCYNSKKVIANRDVIEYNKKYKTMLSETGEKYSNLKHTVFSYVDGAYYLDEKLSNSALFEKYSKVVEVNGIPTDEFIVSQPICSNLFYDGEKNKPARNRLVFNDSFGNKVTVKIENKDKSIIDTELFISPLAVNIWHNSDLTLLSIIEDDFYIYDDDKNKISYVRLDSMHSTNGSTVRSKLKQLKYDDVILDLRDNYGGRPSYASEYIFPELFTKSFEESNFWYMPITEENETIFEDFFNRIRINPQKEETTPFTSATSYYKSKVTYTYEGKAEKDKNIVILTSKSTGSAADRFVSDMKKNDAAIIIGNNTGGEGLMNSYNMVSLPNSKFVCVYMLGGAKNPDGSDNSVYGTAPDYYVSQSIDDYYLEYSTNTSDYNTKIEFDTVLRYAVEFIKNR